MIGYLFDFFFISSINTVADSIINLEKGKDRNQKIVLIKTRDKLTINHLLTTNLLFEHSGFLFKLLTRDLETVTFVPKNKVSQCRNAKLTSDRTIIWKDLHPSLSENDNTVQHIITTLLNEECQDCLLICKDFFTLIPFAKRLYIFVCPLDFHSYSPAKYRQLDKRLIICT